MFSHYIAIIYNGNESLFAPSSVIYVPPTPLSLSWYCGLCYSNSMHFLKKKEINQAFLLVLAVHCLGLICVWGCPYLLNHPNWCTDGQVH